MSFECCRFSELRIVELLDGICDTVSEYELAGVVSDPTAGSPMWQWLHSRSKPPSNATKIEKPQLKQQQRRLQNYCAQLIDKTEDELSAALQKGLSSAGRLADLCDSVSASDAHCNVNRMVCRSTDLAMHKAQQRLPACVRAKRPTR